MKKFYYRVFKFPVYKRWFIITGAQKIRLLNVQTALNELDRWSDIPLEYQRTCISSILGVPEGKYISKSFLSYMVVCRDAKRIAKSLPLSWYIPK